MLQKDRFSQNDSIIISLFDIKHYLFTLFLEHQILKFDIDIFGIKREKDALLLKFLKLLLVSSSALDVVCFVVD